MSRFRLAPTPEQEAALLGHCTHARYIWNLALEQWGLWSVGRRSYPPRYVEQARQLTEARADNEWLRAGSQTVQQQALRDFDQAVTNFLGGSHRRPTWRKAGVHEGFRLSKPLPDAKSYRVSRDRAGRWHIAFAVVPEPIPGPGTGKVVGVDRGVAVSAALSTGEKLKVPTLTRGEKARLRALQQRLARARKGSNRRAKAKTAVARLKARESDRRKDWVEQVSTRLAREFDVIRVERIPAAYTSQTCSRCGTRDRKARESQAVFRCRSCGHTASADVNAAVNIAAGRAVNARGATAVPVAEKREPQLPTSA